MAERCPRFSVIVASRHRETWLKRCLLSIRQQQYPEYEVVVVADAASLAAVDTQGFKTVAFDEANLSRARNIGIAHSAGEYCAFIDDDAAAEPLWLHHLANGLQATSADAAVGFVRGRNGITFQSKAQSIDAEAETRIESVDSLGPFVPIVETGRALKLIGTNMVIKREALVRLDGFDEAYRFFLEDSDLSLRLAKATARLAVFPLAQVHHGFAPSIRRSGKRAPLDLFDIGRSTAYFLRQHTGKATEKLWRRTFQRENARLIKHMVLGTIEPRDVPKRLETLRLGWEQGLRLDRTHHHGLGASDTPFANISRTARGHMVFASRWLSRRAALRRRANAAVTSGGLASIFAFSLTPFRHHVRFTEDGYWLQTGGVFGRSERSGSVVNWCRFADRVGQEIHRVAKERGISETDAGKWWDHSRF